MLTTLGAAPPERVVGRPRSCRHQAMSRPSYFGRTRAAIALTYVDRVSRAWLFLSKYGLDLLIVVAAVASAVGTALRDDPGRPTGATAVVRGARGRRRRPRPARAAPLPVRRSGGHLAGQRGAVLRGRPADRRQGRALRRRDGRRRAARQPAPRRRRRGSAWRSCSAARRSSSTTTRATRPATSSSPRCCSRSAGSSASRCGSGPSRPRPPRSARPGPSGSGRRRPGSRWPRSADGSRGSSTTSSPTPSA